MIDNWLNAIDTDGILFNYLGQLLKHFLIVDGSNLQKKLSKLVFDTVFTTVQG